MPSDRPPSMFTNPPGGSLPKDAATRVPTADTPDMASYLSSRSALIGSDNAQRFDSAKLANLTPLERQAESIVRAIRKREEEEVWNADESTFPGMKFLLGKRIAERTALYDIVKKMPKGALLHCHMDATAEVSYLISEAMSTPNIGFSSPLPLTSAANIASVVPSFKALPPQDPLFSAALSNEGLPPECRVYSSDYVPNTWLPVSYARENFPNGGPHAFDAWIHSLMTFTADEAYTTFRNHKDAWRKFHSTFGIARGLLGYELILKKYIRRVFEDCVSDGIGWVETRINFLDWTMIRRDGTDTFSHRDWMQTYQEALSEFKADLAAKGQGDRFWGAKVIYTTIRIITNEELREYMEDCINLKEEFPDLIGGFDLVGYEDPGITLKDYLPSLLWFQARQKERGVHVPFIFHAGETLGDGTPADHNLFDALLLGTKRIGHGYSLARHPVLMQEVKDRGVLIEVCPISNELLHYAPSISSHPLLILLNHGVPVSLSSDDPGIFGNPGVSYDFFQLIATSEQTGIISCGVLARQSIEFSEMSAKDKADNLAIWDRHWTEFCSWTVKTYGKEICN